MTWLSGIALARAKTIGADRTKKIDRTQVDLSAFDEARVSDKVLARYGANLHPALDDMNAIAQTSAGFEPYRATQFGHALDRFYQAVGRQLSKLDPKDRSKVAKIEVSAMRSFIGEIGSVSELTPAMATLSSMLEPRGHLDVDPKAHAQAAKSSLLDFIRAIEGRDGAVSMIHAHRHAMEMIERAPNNLKASERPELWKAANDLMLEALPRSGADFAKTAHLTALLFHALKDHPRDPRAALAATRAAVFAEQAESREGARQAIAAMPAHVGAIAAALSHVLDANPAGPPELAIAVQQLAQRTVEPADNMAKVLDLVAETPAVRAVLDHLVLTNPQLPEPPAGADAVPYALIRAHAAQQGGDAAALEAEIAAWRKMPAGVALRASLALMAYLNHGNTAPALAAQLTKVAPSILRMDELSRFAAKFAIAFPVIANQLPPEDAGRVAAAFAKRSGDVDQNIAIRAAQICAATAGILADVPLEKIFESLIKLGDASQFGHDPQQMTYDLLRAIAASPLDSNEKAAHVRAAVRATMELGKLDRNPQQTDFPKILEDWTNALADPKQLSWPKTAQKATALRSKRSITSFLEAHPRVPPEVAITAAVHLSEEQLGWWVGLINSTRSQKDVRVLRDVVFAAVALGRIDLIDALRNSSDRARAGPGLTPRALNSKAEHAAMLSAARMIAEHHRLAKLGELPLDRIIQGLAQGGDPAAEISSEHASKALAALNLANIDKPADPEGAKILASVKQEITDLLAFFPVGGQVHNVDTARFRDPLLVGIEETATGQWPRAKFHDEVADRQLKGLSPAALALWEQESITPAAGADGNRPELIEAMQYVRGLKEALPAEWDRAQLDRMRVERDEKIQALHQTKRGSDDHRRISVELAPLTRTIAMVELKLAIDLQVARGADASTALLDLKPYVAAAIGASRKIAGPGITEALQRIAEASAAIKKPGREGIYAADESRLDAYLTAFGGSCVHPSSGFNRASLTDLIMSASYKMGRIMDGDKPIGRTIFRLLPVKLPNGYEGYALRMDKPVLPTSWTTSPPNDQMQLMYRHGLNKAMAMGVPFMVDQAQSQFVADYARGLGCEVNDALNVQLWIDKGHTGMIHNQGMQTSDYFIGWPELTLSQTVIKPNNPEDLSVERNYSMTVIMRP